MNFKRPGFGPVIVMDGIVTGEMAVHQRSLVIAGSMRLTGVQMDERGRGHIHLQAETHEQDEAEPFHLVPIVSHPFCMVKMRAVPGLASRSIAALTPFASWTAGPVPK